MLIFVHQEHGKIFIIEWKNVNIRQQQGIMLTNVKNNKMY